MKIIDAALSICIFYFSLSLVGLELVLDFVHSVFINFALCSAHNNIKETKREQYNGKNCCVDSVWWDALHGFESCAFGV